VVVSQTAEQAPHVPSDWHACVPAVQVPLQAEHPQLCVVLDEPLHAPAVHWPLGLHVSVSVPQAPHASLRVLLGVQTAVLPVHTPLGSQVPPAFVQSLQDSQFPVGAQTLPIPKQGMDEIFAGQHSWPGAPPHIGSQLLVVRLQLNAWSQNPFGPIMQHGSPK
jgi:hypothetical protein